MKVWIRRGALALGVVVAAIAVAAAAVNPLYERKRQRIVPVNEAGVAAATSAEALALGKYLFMSRGCGGCHGPAGTGGVFVRTDDGKPMMASPNITPAGVVAAYTDVDWARVIRHGVKPDGRPVFIMPSQDYARLTNDDLAALIGYAKSLAPAPGAAAEFNLPLPVKAAYVLGKLPDAAELIDHSLPPSAPVPVAVSTEHGKYVAQMCSGCHGAQLRGGPIPGAPPGWPPAADLTPAGSAMAHYANADQFAAMLRTGKRPDGTKVSGVMPFETLAVLNDTDAQALFQYLKTLPTPPAR